MAKKVDGSKPIKSYKHPASKRTNLPTEQTEPFMEEEQKASVVHSPPVRDAGSIPRLSWDRDRSLDSLETPAYPLYIHEKLEPSIFINGLREGPDADQSGLWDQFNGFPENAIYEWYQHQGNWQNRIVRGNSSRVMGSLLAKEGMAGQVQMVYFDPPYGISFKRNFQVSTRSRNVGTGADALPNDQATISAFRDTYKNGIHSYLDGIYRNCVLARELLHDTGSLFLQIGGNVHRIAVLLDEVFGQENRVASIPFAKSGSTSSATLPNVTDYLLWYAKDKPKCKYRQLYEPLTRQKKLAHMSWAAYLELSNGSTRPLTNEEKKDVSLIPQEGRIYRRMPITSMGKSTTGRSDDFILNGTAYKCIPNTQWSVSMEGMQRLADLGRLHESPETGGLHWKIYEDEVPGRRISNLWHKQSSADDIHYVVETDEEIIERCILMATDPGDLVLDITCGSGTTAYISEKWGRRWITTDTSGVAISLARQRVATGFFDYYVLQDSPEGQVLESTLSSRDTSEKPARATQSHRHANDLSKGFVCRRVPYVSAATLAYDQVAPHTLLVDQPYEKKSTIRVSSPFTVESESPYRYIAPNATSFNSADHALDRIASIRSTLEQTGISWGDSKGPRMRFSEISDWPTAEGGGASLITHVGTISQEGTGDFASLGKAAIAIAPDDMTVSAAYINKAAIAAVNMPGKFGALVVIAFEYEASVRSKDFEQRGKLKIFKAQANRDLLIENLKDDKYSYAFVMVGEPDVEVLQPQPGKLTVEVLGFDTYNPAVGNVTPGGARDIDCWMLDTNYNGESFFARRIHFPNKSTDPQIAKLKKKLGRKLDRKAWDAMLSYKSPPFAKPQSGQIAIRIVTNTHTEMTTVINI